MNLTTLSTAAATTEVCDDRTNLINNGFSPVTSFAYPDAASTPEPATSSTTLSDLETYVTNAETHGGGWLILVFHGICDNSRTSTNSLSPSIFTAFLDWLQPRSANGTSPHQPNRDHLHRPVPRLADHDGQLRLHRRGWQHRAPRSQLIQID